MVKTRPISRYHLKLSDLKPLHASWIVGLHNHTQKESEAIIKGFKEAGINEAINDAQGIYERFKNSFGLKFYFP